MREAHSYRHLVVHSPSHGLNTCEPRKKPLFIVGFYESVSSGLGHDRQHASSASCVSPQYVSHGASISSSYKTLGDACLFADGTTCSFIEMSF
jgi:hypothetical protein